MDPAATSWTLPDPAASGSWPPDPVAPTAPNSSAHTTANGRSGLRRSGRPSDINEAPLLSVSFSVFFSFLFSPTSKP
ncbi:Os07g0158100 [Oryza sativa Japonica Group]|uniref:Os07g0158100 protein n=1 Tax=Oryza sativa subsp. japonica TaxID=39947 RepID=A0A0P0X2N2_ORYSJ|nr:hypothetical protein EE612_037239 [Oryza sativa]BAT00132.1 Os07g0158100 [Oryza sativa Japonica Group]